MPGDQALSPARLHAYATVNSALDRLDDDRLADAVAAATALGSGIGGRAAELDVEGVRVFVKRVPLTDLERRPGNLRSTANLFGLPLFYQYGIGSAGFGAWRELAAHLMANAWVLRGEEAGFPLLYHWRILPDSPPEGFADVFGGVDGAVAHWEGSQAVRRRLEAIGGASASLVLFLEHVPHMLAAWLDEHPDAVTWVERDLLRMTGFMSSRGLVHFDPHLGNLLTDGSRVYLADFGLALSFRFELAPHEAEFLTHHLVYDRCSAPRHLLRHHLLDRVRGDVDRETFLRDWSTGHRPAGVPREAAAFLDRHARTAAVLGDFADRLLHHSKRTPFPAAELRATLDDSSPSDAAEPGSRA